jgi:hypothetical protein
LFFYWGFAEIRHIEEQTNQSIEARRLFLSGECQTLIEINHDTLFRLQVLVLRGADSEHLDFACVVLHGNEVAGLVWQINEIGMTLGGFY